uniref:ANIS5_cation-bd domain-containing protein n=1 Tax=Haemonchus contortus TaxID=6289 RepID=A0A7I4YGK3_HAECO
MNNFIFVLAIVGVALCHPGGKGAPGGGSSGSDEMAGPGRRPGPPPPPPPPPFLENLPEEARKEFFTIVLNKNEKIADQMQAIMTWAQKYGFEAQVQEFNANVTKLMEEVKKNATELISALPSALEKLSTIVSNQDQTVTELKDAIKALSAENPKVFHALMSVLGEFKPKHGGRPHKGPKGGPQSEAEIIEFQGFPRGGFPMGGPDSETEFSLPRGIGGGVAFGNKKGGF